MKKAFPLAVFLSASLLGQIHTSRLPSLNVAFAKPPSWAPAHGYRRKHHDDDDHDDNHRTETTLREVIVSRYEEIFRRLDINRDGRISRSEWEESGSLFDRLDKNHDGVLTRNEYDHADEERGFASSIIDKIKDKLASLWGKLW